MKIVEPIFILLYVFLSVFDCRLRSACSGGEEIYTAFGLDANTPVSNQEEDFPLKINRFNTLLPTVSIIQKQIKDKK